MQFKDSQSNNVLDVFLGCFLRRALFENEKNL